MGKLTPPEERAAELRARLSGQAPSRSSRRIAREASTLSNPMFTAALHAASRDARRAELSPTEARLVRMLKIFATDEEVAKYGKIYTKTKAQAGKGTLSDTIFSGVSLNMDGDTPYTEADMVVDAKAMTGDFLSMPESKVIDITTIDTGCIDSSEYMEALSGAGSGITVLSALKPEEKEAEPTYFEGAVDEHFTGHIECWEADDSGDSFYNRMAQTLKDISDLPIKAAVNANAADDWGDKYGSTGKGAEILALIGILGRLVAALLEWLTNDDDLVFRRELAFTTPALISWSRRNNGELLFMFDGGSQGKHELWIKCEATPRSTGILSGWKFSSRSITAAPVVAGSPSDGISLVNFNNELCGVFRGSNDVSHWTKYDGRNSKWSSPTPISNCAIRSGSRPAVATYNDRLYCLYRHHEDNGLYCMSTSNGNNWTTPVYAGGNRGFTNDGPALSLISSSIKTDKSPAVGVYKGSIHCLIRYHDHNTLWVSKYNGSSWTSFQDLGGKAYSASQMAITSAGNMTVGWSSGTDYLINFKDCDTNGNWSSTISWWNNFCISGSPGMANWDGALWVYAGLASV
ncbi:hypothetical protein BPAE_0380g00040 [Botrytis paeoniae]|uniref:Fucose-specific lectin n=1 Tax=Botrytis paeoniae TaxID=278948 RepID=A0A4Z1F6R3_9HELO|nr:hypothetical protein BPAE_0380g00040 [Botrytis paeoniae]